MTTLQFSPFVSTILPEFWTSLSKLKIDELKLSQHPIPIRGSYGPGRSVIDKSTGQQLSLGTAMTFDGDAFREVPVPSSSYVLLCSLSGHRAAHADPHASALVSTASVSPGPLCTIQGSLINFNTVEDFKRSDKQALFHKVSHAVRPVSIAEQAVAPIRPYALC